MQPNEAEDNEKQTEVEDLTLEETVSDDIKGGSFYKFGIEREMKE